MSTQPRRAWKYLAGLMAGQAILYAVIAWLSFSFVYGEGFQQRPILLVMGLFAACFGPYVASLFVALRAGEGRRLTWLIVSGAIGFRAILLLSQPIQEVDIYRYLWDGGVSAQGVSPFRFAPADVLAADQSQSLDAGGWSDDLLRLVQLRYESPGLADALRRVHYPELTTVYPPISQSVFAVASVLTPSDAALSVRVTMMKGVLLIFDLATLALVLWLLRVSGRHLGWGVAYGWCPLVIKEFANSGHLDAIAVCLTTASICCTARHYQVQREHSLRWSAASAVLLGLSVGAKLYAIVLLPLLALVTARRAGLRCGALFGMIGMIASVACLAPMLWLPPADSLSITEDGGAPRWPNDADTTSATSALPSHLAENRSGLSAFLSRWEMNDFLFLIVVENLRPVKAGPDHPQPWFAVVPNGWRNRLASPLTSSLSIDHDRAAFLLARAVTASLFVVIVAALLGRVARDDHLPRFLEAVFLTLAWFWLLSPTQNPWYWTWAFPLIPFARGRAWLAVSGLLFIYYLRVWLMYHWPEPGILGTWYDGRHFFDFVVTWIEFGPWLAWLTIAALVRRLRNFSNAAFEERLCGRLHREAGDLPLESRNHSEHVNEIEGATARMRQNGTTTAVGVEEAVARRYTAAARDRESELCCPVEYSADFLSVIPEEILAKDYGCGDPTPYVREGDTVVDLGSGAGKLCYMLAQAVGQKGSIIRIDCNDEMLALARKYQPVFTQRVGYSNVEFRYGLIQDLRLDLDRLAAELRQHPTRDTVDWLALRTVEDRLRREQPLISDDSVDCVVSKCVLNLVRPQDRQQLFAEVFRVLKRGGRAAISDIVADEDVPEHLQHDPTLWSGCLSGAFREDRFLEAFEEAGFHGIEIVKRQRDPWQTVEGIEFRSITVLAHKGKQGPCQERSQAVIYRGPFKIVEDDDGHVYFRGERMAVCDKTFQLLQREPYAGMFEVVEPRVAMPLDAAFPFDCRRSARRDPRETKGTDYTLTTETSGPCCETDGPCC